MILVFGRTGQIARELWRLHADAAFLGRDAVDLARPNACAQAIISSRPRAVINAAAYTAVDRAEEEEQLVYAVNATAPGEMAKVCAQLAIPLVQLSTDYVFNGIGSRPFKPLDPTDPLSVYGRTKLAGEGIVRKAGGCHAVLRTSWVFSAHGANFVKSMLKLSGERGAIKVVDDQIGGPTPTSEIAKACLVIIEHLRRDSELSGTYHLSGAPDVSWKEFAETIFARSGRSVCAAGISSDQYPTQAARPRNSRLDCTATEAAFGLARPDWQGELDAVLEELRAVELGGQRV